MQRMFRIPFVIAAASVLAFPGELPAKIQAKFIQILANSAGTGHKVCCKDSAVMAELGSLGISNDAGAKVAWGANSDEVKALKAQGKMVICGRLDWLSVGGSIAIVEEGGKPQIYLHMGNIAASGVTLGEGVLKIGRKL